jgi:uncharacterized protein DUF1737
VIYKILEAGSAAKLEEMIAQDLAAGWALHGSVTVCGVFRTWENARKGYAESETEWLYAQAVVHP